MLNDGDTLTFGKAVGKGDEWVKPVIARVQLLSANAQPPFTVPSPSSSDKSRSSSGRYGIHDSSSSSEDSYSSYSDIEEIPPPPSSQKALGLQPFTCASSDLGLAPPSLDLAQATSAYTAVKRLLSPAIRKLPSMGEIIGENLGFLDSSEKSQSIFNSFLRHDGFYSSAYNPPRLNLFSSRLNSRSNSPMDLGSPSSPAQGIVSSEFPILLSEAQKIMDPPSHPPNEPESVSATSVDAEDHLEVPEPNPTPQVVSEAQPPPNAVTPVSVSGEEKRASSAEITEVLQTLKQLETSVAKLQSSRRRYKTRFNSNVAFISRKLSEIDDKFAEVDAEYNVLCDQFDGVQHSDLPDLARQVEELGESFDVLLAQRDEHKEKMPETFEFQPLEDREDVKASIKTLHNLVDEMREVHERTKTEMSKELLEIRAMREEAMKDIAQAKAEIAAAATSTLPAAQIQVRVSPEVVYSCDFTPVVNHRPHQTPVLTSLKRKRDDMDGDEDDVQVDTVDLLSGRALAEVQPLSDGMCETDTFDVTTAFEIPDFYVHEIHRPDDPPPRKRIRRVGSIIAQTATAITIGAVVTWSALAFS